MDVLEAITARYSVRGYKPEPVERPDAAARARSGASRAGRLRNRQPFRLIVVHTHGRERSSPASTRVAWFAQAPRGRRLWSPSPAKANGGAHRRQALTNEVDAAIVMDHLVLAATSLGLGTCWVAASTLSPARRGAGSACRVEP